MRAVDIISKKRDGGELSTEEIEWFVRSFTDDEIPDYQAAAWLMAVYLRGMSARETSDLTLALAYSGQVLDLSQVTPFAVDKHSTGGVGDKTTLVVEPLVAACGQPMAKMSGRGLGFSGGTLDKLESIRGFRVNLSINEFLHNLRAHGMVLAGQSADLAPADGKLYALRDVTATVSSLPLIASSIMSKKIAAGAQAIVLDVKVGLGAFRRTIDEAVRLAETMVAIGRDAGREVVALISDMNQPLGQAVGNALEVVEAIETLRGNGPADFREHCLAVASHLLVLAQKAEDLKAARERLEAALVDGRGYAKFRELVEAQGGDVSQVENPDALPRASMVRGVSAPRAGYLAVVNAAEVGLTSVDLGAGRFKKGDPIDHAVGILVHHKVGDHVQAGEPLFTIHASDPVKMAAAEDRLLRAVEWSDTPVEPLPLFYQTIR
jgi:pyrimidine-nucleoside phosphorylase